MEPKFATQQIFKIRSFIHGFCCTATVDIEFFPLQLWFLSLENCHLTFLGAAEPGVQRLAIKGPETWTLKLEPLKHNQIVMMPIDY
jgi:hypothetical protein